MVKYLVRGSVVGLTLACALGCSGGSGDDDDDDDNGVTSEAAGKCNQLVELYCPAVMDCLVEGGTLAAKDRDTSVSQCVTGAKQALDCSRAAEVSSSYDACIETLKSPDCTAINDAVASGGQTSPLPSVCMGVILLGE